MAAVFRDKSGAPYSTTAADFPTSAPPGTQAGDALLLAVYTYGGTVATPPGWAQLEQETNPGPGSRLAVFARLADGTADDAPTVTWAGSLNAGFWKMYAWLNDSPSDGALGFEASDSNEGHSASPQLAAGFATAAADTLAWLAAGDSFVPDAPSGWTTEEQDVSSGFTMADLAQGAPGATGTAAGSMTTDAWIVAVVAVAPPAPAPRSLPPRRQSRARAHMLVR